MQRTVNANVTYQLRNSSRSVTTKRVILVVSSNFRYFRSLFSIFVLKPSNFGMISTKRGIKSVRFL